MNEAVDVRSRIAEQLAFARQLLRWIALGALSGVLAGLSSWVFLKGLERVTEFREHGRQWLVFLLPLAGMGMGAAYHYLGGRSHEGTNLLIDEIHEPTEWVPRRMAPLVLIGTWASHLFGASVGREGTALQMSGSLTDGLSRVIRLSPADRRVMLVAALAGGFGAVFGVPVAGAVFALEVQGVGRMRFEPIVPALTAAIVGDRMLIALGYHHTAYATMAPHVTPWMLIRVAAAGLLFGAVAAAFAHSTHALKKAMAKQVTWAPARPLMGGIVVIALVTIFGHAYQGLSLPYLVRAMEGDHLSFAVFALKLLFTVVCVGTGFFGGEVTPLFVMGATLGAALALPFGISGGLLAAIGFCAVFGAAANAPIACIIMGAELFGSGTIVPIAIGCVVAYIVSGHQGIYSSQRVFGRKLDFGATTE
ncbi:MAG: voltage-gated chloride channel protein [Ilumatobacteraceae bacterium]|nr:voltage-gated chloride channel protein [Ilumatobacteraceae bacterium]